MSTQYTLCTLRALPVWRGECRIPTEFYIDRDGTLHITELGLKRLEALPKDKP